MDSYASSRYEGSRDLPALIQFAQKVTAACSPGASYYHPGDFVWQLYEFEASDDVRIWRDARDVSRLVACAIFEPPLTYEFTIGPDVDDEHALIKDVFRWADERRAAATNKTDIPIAYQQRGEHTLSTSALASDRIRIQVLLKDGYTVHEGKSYRNARALDGDIPSVALPPGAEFRTVTERDLEERAELHRDAWSVWGASTFDVARLRKLRASPMYEPDLDVVLTHEGRMVSYCVCWPDDANKIGLFEPVGTRADATRRGFGRMVLYEAFRRLRERGMATAVVGPTDVNQPAMALYASAGFEVVEEVHTYVKTDRTD